MQSVTKLSDALNPKIEAAKAAVTTAVLNDADTKTISALTKELEVIRMTQTRMLRDEAREAKLSQACEPDVDDDEETAERAEARELVKAHIRANILANDDYYYIHDMEKFMLHREADNSWTAISDRAMKNHYPKLVPGSDYWQIFMDVLREDERWFYGRTSSFNPPKGKLNLLRPQMLEPVDGPVHPLFKLVVRSICGDKAENIDHLEKVILAKRLKPENYLLPVICLSDAGATGKSLFVSKVLPAMFGATSVAANTKMSDFSGQFNGHLSGKLAIMINENCEDSYNHNMMKAIAGSPTIMFTNKGQMPYEADNTALLFVTGNSVAGSIRVDGGDVDRRFSLIRATNKLSHYTAPWLSSELGGTVTEAEAEAWMRSKGQDILSDTNEVAKWLTYLITKHGQVTDVPALHGQDYLEAVATQKSLMIQVFEAFFNDPAFNYIRKNLVYDFYRAECQTQGNRASMGKGKFYKAIENWLAKHRADITSTDANWGNSTATVYATKAATGNKSKPTLQPNDNFYFVDDGYRREWKVAI